MNRSATARAIGLMLLADIVVPIACYYLLRAFVVGEVLALGVGGALSGLRVLIEALLRRRFDAVAGVVLGLFALELIAFSVSGNARFVLAADSIPTAVLGVVFIGSLFARHALAYRLLLGLLTGGQREAEQFWQRAWADGPTFRHALRMLTLGSGCLLLAEAALRIVLVIALPFDVLVSVSKLLPVVLIAAMLGFAGWYGKRTGLGVRPYLESIGVDAEAPRAQVLAGE
ncbi:MAG TPA: VC0807 family protein [Pseudonocardiaceae bacterium]|jgi:hypothetical protein|nr:VC0807 family protein [Pseudonocardiaceae bacterium]